MEKYIVHKNSNGKLEFHAETVPDIKEQKPAHPSLNRSPSEKKVWLEIRAY